MAFTEKGSRLIVIDGVDYRWKTALHTRKNGVFQDLLIAKSDSHGATLLKPVETWPSPWIAPMLTPATARAAILEGLDEGWKPDIKGPQHRLKPIPLNDESLPVINPKKSAGHCILYIVMEMTGLTHENPMRAILDADFADGRKRKAHFHWMQYPGRWNNNLIEDLKAAQNKAQSWFGRWKSLAEVSDRKIWAQTYMKEMLGDADKMVPNAETIRLTGISQADFAEQMSVTLTGFPLSDNKISGFCRKWADMLWAKFPEIYQIHFTKAEESREYYRLLPPSLFIVDQERKFAGTLIFHGT